MKKQIKVAALSTLLLTSITAPTVSLAKEPIISNVLASEKFSDVDKNHYAYEAIKWAQQQGIVSGYTDSKGKPNSKFGPNDSVTEAQFAKMLVEFYGFKDDKGDLNRFSPTPLWSDTYYDALAAYGVPLNGYFDSGLRNKSVKRGVVAQTIGHISGNANSLTDSINYMIGEGITTGQNPQYENKDLFKYFGTNNTLTRAQAVAFLYRMHNIGVNTAGGIAVLVYNNTEGLSLAALANKGVSKLDSSLNLGSLGNDKPVNNEENNNSGTISPNETNPEYSNSKIPIATDATRIDVNTINKVVSKMSDASYKKIISAGYEVTDTDVDLIRLEELTIALKDSSGIGFLTYNKSVSPDLITGLTKELFGITITQNDIYPSFEKSTTSYYISASNGGTIFTLRTKK